MLELYTYKLLSPGVGHPQARHAIGLFIVAPVIKSTGSITGCFKVAAARSAGESARGSRCRTSAEHERQVGFRLTAYPRCPWLRKLLCG